MKNLKKLSLLAVVLLTSVATAFAQQKPNVYILATGGTIAGTGKSATASGYTAGQVYPVANRCGAPDAGCGKCHW